MNPADFMPYVVAIFLILALVQAIYSITIRAIDYRERMEMFKRGFVPKDYQPIPRNDAAQSPTKSDQPAALPPAPWDAQWQEGVPTSRYPGELAKGERSLR